MSEQRHLHVHAVFCNVQNFQLFPNLTFKLQRGSYVCALRVDAILHLAPPARPKGRMYNINIYVYRISSKRRRGYYLFQRYCNVASIRGRLFPGRRLIPLRVLTCNFVPSTFTCQFPADAMTDREEFVFICSFMCTGLLGSPSWESS